MDKNYVCESTSGLDLSDLIKQSSFSALPACKPQRSPRAAGMKINPFVLLAPYFHAYLHMI